MNKKIIIFTIIIIIIISFSIIVQKNNEKEAVLYAKREILQKEIKAVADNLKKDNQELGKYGEDYNYSKEFRKNVAYDFSTIKTINDVDSGRENLLNYIDSQINYLSGSKIKIEELKSISIEAKEQHYKNIAYLLDNFNVLKKETQKAVSAEELKKIAELAISFSFDTAYINYDILYENTINIFDKVNKRLNEIKIIAGKLIDQGYEDNNYSIIKRIDNFEKKINMPVKMLDADFNIRDRQFELARSWQSLIGGFTGMEEILSIMNNMLYPFRD